MIRTRLVRWAPLLLPALALPTVLLPLTAATQADPPQGQKYALLVGVHQYDKNQLRDLPYTEDDVTALADVLRQAGYKRVMLMTQTEGAKQARSLPEASRIRIALKGILEDRSADDTVLVAFAGHGVQFAGEDENYFCPMDAKLEDKTTLIALGEVYKALEKSAAGTRLLLADCCRNDPRSEQARAVDKVKLESVTRPQKAAPPGGVTALFSCSAGEKAFESADLKHGVFFHFVIEGLQGKADLDHDGQVSVEELELYTKRQVPDYVKEQYGDDVRQMPERVGQTRGLVALVTLDGRGRTDATTDAPRPKPDVTTGVPPATPTGARPAPLDCTGDKGVSAADVRKAQEAWAKYLGRKVEEEDEIAPGVKMKFVLVPPGKFLMGSPQTEKDYVRNTFGDAVGDDAKQEILHEVELTKPLYLGVYDVTQGQYEAVTGKVPSKFRGADLPVEQVNWDEADAFAKGLTEKAKDGLLYRLPTEAEWEYSCRGGRPSSQPFGIGDGTSLSSREANFNGDDSWPDPPGSSYGGAKTGPYLEKTSPVGSYKANALGLYDMQGNVYQWCGDWYGNYPTDRVVNPEGPGTGSKRVSRGGGWGIYSVWNCRAAARSGFEPDYRISILGFRLARVPSGLSK